MNSQRKVQVDLLFSIASWLYAGQSALRAILMPKIDLPDPKNPNLTYHMLDSDFQKNVQVDLLFGIASW